MVDSFVMKKWTLTVTLAADANPANPCTNPRTMKFELIDQGIPGCEPNTDMIINKLDLIGPYLAPVLARKEKAPARKRSPKGTKKSAKRPKKSAKSRR